MVYISKSIIEWEGNFVLKKKSIFKHTFKDYKDFKNSTSEQQILFQQYLKLRRKQLIFYEF